MNKGTSRISQLLRVAEEQRTVLEAMRAVALPLVEKMRGGDSDGQVGRLRAKIDHLLRRLPFRRQT